MLENNTNIVIFLIKIPVKRSIQLGFYINKILIILFARRSCHEACKHSGKKPVEV